MVMRVVWPREQAIAKEKEAAANAERARLEVCIVICSCLVCVDLVAAAALLIGSLRALLLRVSAAA
jgi:hypothetical protein